MTPIELLEKECKSLERDLEKSNESHSKNEISYTTHRLHWANITPQILKYKLAIRILKQSK